MSERLTAHDQVYDLVDRIAEERGITKKEALRDLIQEAGYDV